jgi:hypothetical protein
VYPEWLAKPAFFDPAMRARCLARADADGFAIVRTHKDEVAA